MKFLLILIIAISVFVTINTTYHDKICVGSEKLQSGVCCASTCLAGVYDEYYRLLAEKESQLKSKVIESKSFTPEDSNKLKNIVTNSTDLIDQELEKMKSNLKHKKESTPVHKVAKAFTEPLKKNVQTSQPITSHFSFLGFIISKLKIALNKIFNFITNSWIRTFIIKIIVSVLMMISWIIDTIFG